MNQIGRPKNYPVVSTDAYREGWDRIWGEREEDEPGRVDPDKAGSQEEDVEGPR